ncbi:InlB B-repeat-containing protein [Parabacteroides sp.]
MKTTFIQTVYRCLLIAVVCCVLPLIGSTYAKVAAQDPPVYVTITQPAIGGTFTATTQDGTELSNGSNSVADGTVLTLAATPTTGYRLVKFTADDTELKDNPSTYSVHGKLITISAVFERVYTVTITQPAGGGTFTATYPPANTLSNGANADIPEGTILTLTAAPAENYRFMQFMADGVRTSSPYTVTSNVTLSVEFVPIPVIPDPPASVTILQPATGGTFKAAKEDGTTSDDWNFNCKSGDVLTLTATPDPGYRLVKFTANGTEISSPYTVVPGQVTLSAEFEQILHTVTVTQPAEGGTFTATYPPGNTLQNGANADIPEGTVLTLTAAPAEGYRLVRFTANNAEITSPYTVSGEVSISAEFVQLHTVTVTQPAEGGTFTATYSPANTLQNGVNTDIPEGTILTLTSTSATGYRFVKFTAGGTEVTSPYTVTGDVAISVEFEKTSSPPTPPTPPSPPVDPGDDTPTVYYIVTLPAVEGATTDPVAGSYEVESWSNFRFFLTLDKEYDKSEPVVTTSGGTTIIPHAGNGAYIIENVRQPLEIRIDGIMKNPDPVANETVETNQSKVWAAEGHLHIEVATDGQAYIFTTDGRLLKMQLVTAGETLALPLPEGFYIVRIGNERFKVLL